MSDPNTPGPADPPQPTSQPQSNASTDLLWARPGTTRNDLQLLCRDLSSLGIHGLAVQSGFIAAARHFLEDTGIKVIALVGWPWGAMDVDVKRFEIETAIDHGADEIEAVIDPGRIKIWHQGGTELRREILDLVEAADEHPLRIVAESSMISHFQLDSICRLALESGASGFQPGSGMIDQLPNADWLDSVPQVINPLFHVKVAGGVRNGESASRLLELGIRRIGVSTTTFFSIPATQITASAQPQPPSA